MRNSNLFFCSGDGKMENQQIVLNSECSVVVVDGDNEFLVENVKKIDVKTVENDKVKISLGPQVTFVSKNKKMVINQSQRNICIEMLSTEDQLEKYTQLVNTQEAYGLIDYIAENAPDLYSRDDLMKHSLEDLRKLKESMDDLANCY